MVIYMTVRPFRPSDLKSVNKWLTRHGHPKTQPSDIPSKGFIVPGVAVGFVRDCETGVGMIDSYVTNSLCSRETRHSALEAVTKKILEQPFKYFITMTADDGLVSRFKNHGLTGLPQYLWLAKVGN